MKRVWFALFAVMLWALPAHGQTNITLPATLTCSDGFAIVFASGLPTCASTGGVGTVTNTAFTTGTIPKASGGAALVDSHFSESGSTGTYTGTFNATVAVQLNGTAYASPTQLAVLADNETVTGAWLFTQPVVAAGDTAYASAGTYRVSIGWDNDLERGWIQSKAASAAPLDINPSGGAVTIGGATTITGAMTATGRALAANYSSSAGAVNPASSGVTTGFNAGFDVNTEFGWIQVSRENVSNLRGLQIQPLGGGVTFGAPTGGFKGDGTINAVAVYDDNVLLSDWVFEDFYGEQRQQDEPKHVRGPKMDRRLFALTETKTVTQSEKRLPWMPKASEFEAERNIGGMMTRLWIGQEQQQLYIFELESRIVALEKGKK